MSFKLWMSLTILLAFGSSVVRGAEERKEKDPKCIASTLAKKEERQELAQEHHLNYEETIRRLDQIQENLKNRHPVQLSKNTATEKIAQEEPKKGVALSQEENNRARRAMMWNIATTRNTQCTPSTSSSSQTSSLSFRSGKEKAKEESSEDDEIDELFEQDTKKAMMISRQTHGSSSSSSTSSSSQTSSLGFRSGKEEAKEESSEDDENLKDTKPDQCAARSKRMKDNWDRDFEQIKLLKEADKQAEAETELLQNANSKLSPRGIHTESPSSRSSSISSPSGKEKASEESEEDTEQKEQNEFIMNIDHGEDANNHVSSPSNCCKLCAEANAKRIRYEEYAQKNILGACSTKIEASMAKEVLRSAPSEVRDKVRDIKKGALHDGEKDFVLFGLPGTGKTTIIKAMAQQCNIPCFLFDASLISDSYLNSGQKRLKAMFALAKKYGGRCILAIDEMDVLIQKYINPHSQEASMLTTIWKQIDEAWDTNVIIAFTMNYKKDLPMQVIGRLAEIYIPLPNRLQRERALQYHLDKKKEGRLLLFENGIAADKISQMTYEFSQRDISRLVTKATAHAIRRPHKIVLRRHFEDAISIISKEPQWQKERKEYRAELATRIPRLTKEQLAERTAFYAKIWDKNTNDSLCTIQ